MSVGFVGNGVSLGIYLSQGIIHRFVHLQFEDIDVVLGLYHHIGSAENLGNKP